MTDDEDFEDDDSDDDDRVEDDFLDEYRERSEFNLDGTPRKKGGKKIVVDLGAGKDTLVIEENNKYTGTELDLMADDILRAHSRATSPETGKPNGIKGDAPILFEEHIYARKRREIYNQNGVPEPSINEGMFWRPHPQGRKVNSDEQRRRHGASFYR